MYLLLQLDSGSGPIRSMWINLKMWCAEFSLCGYDLFLIFDSTHNGHLTFMFYLVTSF